MSLDETCVHYRAHKNNPEDAKYKCWGCNSCDGYNKECDKYASLASIMYPEEQIEEKD